MSAAGPQVGGAFSLPRYLTKLDFASSHLCVAVKPRDNFNRTTQINLYCSAHKAIGGDALGARHTLCHKIQTPNLNLRPGPWNRFNIVCNLPDTRCANFFPPRESRNRSNVRYRTD